MGLVAVMGIPLCRMQLKALPVLQDHLLAAERPPEACRETCPRNVVQRFAGRTAAAYILLCRGTAYVRCEPLLHALEQARTLRFKRAPYLSCCLLIHIISIVRLGILTLTVLQGWAGAGLPPLAQPCTVPAGPALGAGSARSPAQSKFSSGAEFCEACSETANL
jgi:hypothetical protein